VDAVEVEFVQTCNSCLALSHIPISHTFLSGEEGLDAAHEGRQVWTLRASTPTRGTQGSCRGCRSGRWHGALMGCKVLLDNRKIVLLEVQSRVHCRVSRLHVF